MATKTTSPVIVVLIGVLGFIVGYFYYSNTKQVVDVPIDTKINDAAYLKFKSLKFDLEFLKKEQFASLKVLGEYPINPGATGKQNLFE